jgi:uncharacterized radical SAM protein YgiQ
MTARASFLPVSRADMEARGWTECDFIFVSGDAYVDHPSFAAALLGRLLEAEGYRVCILAQPRWQGSGATEDFTRFGQPRLGWLVSAGAMDSMVSRYTANNKPRSEDSYSPGGASGFRPDRALLAYTAKIREVSKGKPLIIGGIEASLRRFAHYDYWSNTVKHSILLDTKADLLIYGMGERAILEVAARLAESAQHAEITGTGNAGEAPQANLHGIRGTAWRCGREADLPDGAVMLPSFEEIKADRAAYCDHFLLQEQNTDPINAHVVVERSETRFVVQEKPALPLDAETFDKVMELPYIREWHPDYDASGGIPALAEVQFSLTSCRGCFGACSFCAITFHQGRLIQTRSHESLVKEAAGLSKRPDFKGYIHDVGGPTANFREPACAKQTEHGACPDRQCLGDSPCPALKADHKDYVSLLRKLRAIPGIKKVFVRSGIRFDYVMLDPDPDKTFLRELCEHHVSGQLKVAPEHTSDRVLSLMRKSDHRTYEKFADCYTEINAKIGKKQYLVPYYIASHPGATLEDALNTALELKKTGFIPDQVQDFYPTPGTLATCMYYTGLDPSTKTEIHVARGAHERALQRALLQFNKPENRALVREALSSIGREGAFAALVGSAQGHQTRATADRPTPHSPAKTPSGQKKDRH